MSRLPVFLVSLLLASGTVRAQDGRDVQAPMEVTTDTGSYCSSLWRQIRAYGALPREVRDLQTEGHELCSTGQVRGGINRLRRALMVLHAGSPEPDGIGEPQEAGDPPKRVPSGPHG